MWDSQTGYSRVCGLVSPLQVQVQKQHSPAGWGAWSWCGAEGHQAEEPLGNSQELQGAGSLHVPCWAGTTRERKTWYCPSKAASFSSYACPHLSAGGVCNSTAKKAEQGRDFLPSTTSLGGQTLARPNSPVSMGQGTVTVKWAEEQQEGREAAVSRCLRWS